MDHIDEDGFRANVGIILANREGMVLLGGRIGKGGWQFPQGGMQVDETPSEAMYRELEEEVGLSPEDVEVLAHTQDWVRYRLPDRFVRKNSKPICIGQKQRWFVLRLTSTEDRLCVDGGELPEFDRWRWVDYWHPVKEVIYFKRRVYVTALQELGPALFPDGLPPQPQWWPSEWLLNPER
jgi:putative (di)nucleoside polyphosphate hydrolase